MLYTFPPITLSFPFALLPSSCPSHTHARRDPLARTHVQYGKTALMVACENKHEAAAAELMEATKLAGALDLQVAHEAGQGGCVV